MADKTTINVPYPAPIYDSLTLVLWDGRQIPAAALDIGTVIVGKKLDIFVDTVQEAINLRIQSVTKIL